MQHTLQVERTKEKQPVHPEREEHTHQVGADDGARAEDAQGHQWVAGSRFDQNKMYQRRYLSDRFFELVEEYSGLARDSGLTPVQLAYGWLAARPGVDSVLLGPADVGQLDAGIDGCARPIGPDLCVRIDEIHRAFTGTDTNYARVN